MNKPQILNLFKLIRAANRKDKNSSIALKSALLGLLIGVNWLEEAAAAELTAVQINLLVLPQMP